MTITDDCTRYGWVFLMKDRSSKALKALFEKWKKQVECQTGEKVKKVRLGNSGEFRSLAEDDENEGIEFGFIISYAHEQKALQRQ